MNEQMPLLELRDITKQFGHAGTTALDHVNISVGTREVVGVVGESGSGKSTLARIMLGIETPTSGTLLLRGKELGTRTRTRPQRKDIQIVFQDPRSSLNPRMPIFSSVEDFAIVHGLGDAKERRRRVEQALDRVHLSAKVASRRPPELSGGQLQRVCLARALVADPVLLLADEPTSSLDVSVQGQILNLLHELRESLAIVLISHDMNVINFMADRVYVLYRGQVVEHGSRVQVLQEPTDTYTQRLVGAAHSLTSPSPEQK